MIERVGKVREGRGGEDDLQIDVSVGASSAAGNGFDAEAALRIAEGAAGDEWGVWLPRFHQNVAKLLSGHGKRSLVVSAESSLR